MKCIKAKDCKADTTWKTFRDTNITRTDRAGSQQWTAVSLLLELISLLLGGWRYISSLHSADELQQERDSCPMLRSCFIGSFHVGVSKRFSRSISLAVFCLYEFYMFDWQEQYLTSGRSERVRYCSCHENIKFIYYIDESVLLGTKPLVDLIRHFIRHPSGVFSVCHLCECHIVQWHQVCLLNCT